MDADVSRRRLPGLTGGLVCRRQRGCGSDPDDHIVSLAGKPFKTLPEPAVRRG